MTGADTTESAPRLDAQASGITRYRSLGDIAREVRKELKATDDARLRIGRLLIEAKAGISRGDWLIWLKREFPERSVRDMQACMSMARADDPEAAREEEKGRKRAIARKTAARAVEAREAEFIRRAEAEVTRKSEALAAVEAAGADPNPPAREAATKGLPPGVPVRSRQPGEMPKTAAEFDLAKQQATAARAEATNKREILAGLDEETRAALAEIEKVRRGVREARARLKDALYKRRAVDAAIERARGYDHAIYSSILAGLHPDASEEIRKAARTSLEKLKPLFHQPTMRRRAPVAEAPAPEAPAPEAPAPEAPAPEAPAPASEAPTAETPVADDSVAADKWRLSVTRMLIRDHVHTEAAELAPSK